MENVSLPPGRVEERMAQRAKYRLAEEGEWFFFQTRCLDNIRRINEFFKDESFKEKIPTPEGVVMKMMDEKSVIVNDHILERYDCEYYLEHDEQVVHCWEKAIILENIESLLKKDDRVIVRPYLESEVEEEEEMPSLL